MERRGGGNETMEADTGDVATSQGALRTAGSSQKLGGGLEHTVPEGPWKAPPLLTTQFQTSNLQDCERMNTFLWV